MFRKGHFAGLLSEVTMLEEHLQNTLERLSADDVDNIESEISLLMVQSELCKLLSLRSFIDDAGSYACFAQASHLFEKSFKDEDVYYSEECSRDFANLQLPVWTLIKPEYKCIQELRSVLRTQIESFDKMIREQELSFTASKNEAVTEILPITPTSVPKVDVVVEETAPTKILLSRMTTADLSVEEIRTCATNSIVSSLEDKERMGFTVQEKVDEFLTSLESTHGELTEHEISVVNDLKNSLKIHHAGPDATSDVIRKIISDYELHCEARGLGKNEWLTIQLNTAEKLCLMTVPSTASSDRVFQQCLIESSTIHFSLDLALHSAVHNR